MTKRERPPDDSAEAEPTDVPCDLTIDGFFKCLSTDERTWKPRENQQNVAKTACSALEGHVAIEMQTGSGKSFVGLYVIQQAIKEGLRAAYVCPVKALQMQVMRDASRVGRTFGWTTFCQYGKGNYLCSERVNALEMPTGVAAHAWRQIRTFLLERATAPEKSDPFWTQVGQHRDQFNALVQALGTSVDAKAVWDEVSGKHCKCRKRALDNRCPANYFSIFARDADLIVISTSYLFTCAAHDILRYTINYDPSDDGLPPRFLVMDEAHLITEKADTIFDMYKPPELQTRDARSFIQARRTTGECPIGVDDSFKACAAFETMRTKKLAFSDIGISFDVPEFCEMVKHFTVAEGVDQEASALVAALQTIKKNIKGRVTALQEALESRETTEGFEKTFAAAGFAVDAHELARCYEQSRVGTPDEQETKSARLWREVKKIALPQEDLPVTAPTAGLWKHCVHMLGGLGNFDAEAAIKETMAIKKMATAVRTAKLAASMDAWERHAQRSIEVAPIAHSDLEKAGVRYELTPQGKRAALHAHLWAHFPHVLYLSATITYPNEVSLMRLFECEIGRTLDRKQRTEFEFDYPKNLRVFVFAQPTYNYKKESEKPALYQARLTQLAQQMEGVLRQNETKMTLVVGTKNEEVKHLMERVAQRMKDRKHIVFNEEQALFQALRDSNESNGEVIYGTKALSTGVDLPGRVGAVVVLRPLNEPTGHMLTYCVQQRLLTNSEMWTLCQYKTYQRLKQTIGRALRCDTDAANVYLFSMQGNDAALFNTWKPCLVSEARVTRR